MKRHSAIQTVVVLSVAGFATGVFGQTSFTEIEPNETKTQATPVVGMVAGDSIVGNSTGNLATPGPTSQDTFRVRTGTLPLALYRHRLILTTPGTAGHTGSIRGLTQTAGIPTPGTDAILQNSSSFTSPARSNQWYGSGRSEEVYYRVVGTAATTADYTATLETTTIAPVTIWTSFAAGSLTMTTVGQTGATQTDTDLWVYDADLNPIATFGNDDEPSPGTTHGSRLTRTFAAGTYYLAISNYNVCNNLGSPFDDSYAQGAVADFPNVILNGSSTGTVGAPLDVSFRITDSAAADVPVAAFKNESYGVLWFKFFVGVTPPCYANCDQSTFPPILNANDFQCFLNAYASLASYANCDGSTFPPVLNANDFQCFLNAYAAGCS